MTKPQCKLTIVPCTLAEANEFIRQYYFPRSASVALMFYKLSAASI